MYKLKHLLSEATNPVVMKSKIQNALQSGKDVGVFANGKNLDIPAKDKEALGIDSVWALDDDGKEFEVNFKDIEFITVDGVRMAEGTLGGKAPEDPTTSGEKFNQSRRTGKQTAIGPYDVDEDSIAAQSKRGRMTPEDAAQGLFNGNVSEYKAWAKYATKNEFLDSVVEYGRISPYKTDGAIKYIKKLVI